MSLLPRKKVPQELFQCTVENDQTLYDGHASMAKNFPMDAWRFMWLMQVEILVGAENLSPLVP